MVDPAFVELAFGIKGPTTVAARCTTVMTVLQMHTSTFRMSPLHRDSMLRTSGGPLAARKERDERKRRHRKVVTELRKYQCP